MKFKLKLGRWDNLEDILKKSVLKDIYKCPDLIFDTDRNECITLPNRHNIKLYDIIISTSNIEVLPENTEIPLLPFSRSNYNVEYLDINSSTEYLAGTQATPFYRINSTDHPEDEDPYFYSRYITDFKYDPYVLPDAEGNAYTLPAVQKINLLQDYTTEQLRGRYLFIDRPRNGLQNVVLDSFLPRLLYKHKLDIAAIKQEENIPKTAYSVSPFVANILNTNQIPLTDLIAYFGYNSKTLKQLLTAVKRKHLNFVMLGLGGTGSNTIYWLYQMAQHCNIINLFESIYLFEAEQMEISNTIRFSYPLSDYYKNSYSADKLNMAIPYAEKLSNKVVTSEDYLTKDNIEFYRGIIRNRKTTEGTVLYGAPSMEYRNFFSELGNFISATHSDNECSLWLNPITDDEMVVETYGLIQLNSFFMNQIKLVLGLLELLASDQDLQEKDKHIFDHEFNGIPLSPLSRVYNWNLSRQTQVLTQEESRNV